jgi:hypothetical protein
MDQAPVVDPGALEVGFIPTVDDQVHAIWEKVKVGRGKRLWVSFLMFVLVANVVSSVWREGVAALRGAAGYTLVLVIAVAAGFLRRRQVMRWGLARHARAYPDRYAPVVYTFGADALRLESKFGSTEVPWSSFTQVRETKELFLFGIGSVDYYVPRRALRETDEARLRTLVAARLGARAELMTPTDD